MGNSLGGWRLLVHVFLPIPLVLTILLVIPLPRNIRKGILMFTHKTLTFTVVGGMKLVHFALIASGVPLVDSTFRTYNAALATEDPTTRPELKIQLLAKKWREERNFWIATMGFTLWCLLSVLFAQVSHLVKVEEELEAAEDEVCDLKGIPRPVRTSAVAARVEAARKSVGSGVAEARRRVGSGVEDVRKRVGDGVEDVRKRVGSGVEDVQRRVEDAKKTVEGAVSSAAEQIKARTGRRNAASSPPGTPEAAAGGSRGASPLTRRRAAAAAAGSQ